MPKNEIAGSDPAPKDVVEFQRIVQSYSDLTMARQCAQLLRGRIGPNSPSRRNGDDGEAHALAFSHALIVSYSRPFTRNVDLDGAKRTSKDSFLQHLHDEQYAEEEKLLHKKLLRLRNKVVAHSDAEASEVSIYSQEDSRYTVHSWRGRNLLSRAEVDLILDMTAKLKPLVVKRWEELNSTLPPGPLWRHLK